MYIYIMFISAEVCFEFCLLVLNLFQLNSSRLVLHKSLEKCLNNGIYFFLELSWVQIDLNFEYNGPKKQLSADSLEFVWSWDAGCDGKDNGGKKNR